MDVQERNSTRIYALSAGPTLPEWMGERARRNLSKRDSNIRRRIELIQDFSMPVASSKIIQSRDGNYLIAAGTYSPRIRCYELEEMSMKFERILDSDIVDLCFVGASEDYGKLAVLQADRTIQFHAPYGHHASIRIPTFGRSLAYEPTTCELLVACSPKDSGGQVYRFNLEEGRFAAPLPFSNTSAKSSSGCGANCIAVSPTHALTALGCEDGLVRFWDNRMSNANGSGSDNGSQYPFVQLDVKSSTAGFGYSDQSSSNTYSSKGRHEITSMAFDGQSGMHLAVGTHGGNVALYDMRSSKPLHVKEHQYGLPIHTLQFHAASSTVLSADAKLVKIWRAKPASNASSVLLEPQDDDLAPMTAAASDTATTGVGSIVSNIEGAADFTHFLTAGDSVDPTGNSSGLVLCAGEQPKMQAFYCPALGAAPRWCSFLDSITEELEERDHNEAAETTLGTTMDMMTGKATGTIYEDYKFLTRSEIDQLGIQNLVGTPLLRGYMHGFFIDIGLYNRVRAVANPFEYEEYRKKKIRQKMEEKRASLIAPKNNDNHKKKVNSALADRLQDKASKTKSSGKAAKSLLADDRFGSLFTNPDFEIDEQDTDFKLRNPSGVAQTKKQRQAEDMDSDDNDNDSHNDNYKDYNQDNWNNNDNDSHSEDYDEDSHSDDDDSVSRGKVRGEMYEQMKQMERELKQNKKKNIKEAPKKKKKMVMLETEDHAVDVGLGDTSSKQNNRHHQQHMSLEKRLAKQNEMGQRVQHVKSEGASREVTFIPKDTQQKKKKMEEQKQAETTNYRSSKRSRRGIQDLRLKTPFKNQ